MEPEITNTVLGLTYMNEFITQEATNPKYKIGKLEYISEKKNSTLRL